MSFPELTPPEGALTRPESWQNIHSLVPDLVFTRLGSFPVFAQELQYILRSLTVPSGRRVKKMEEDTDEDVKSPIFDEAFLVNLPK